MSTAFQLYFQTSSSLTFDSITLTLLDWGCVTCRGVSKLGKLKTSLRLWKLSTGMYLQWYYPRVAGIHAVY